MGTFNILTYLEKRQHGYSGINKKVYDIYMNKLCCIPVDNFYTHMANIEIGNTFACKFSKNKPNLHILGCASEYGHIVVQNTHGDTYNNIEPQFHRSKLHDNAIFNFAWADSHMKLVTACGDQTSKLCSLNPSGKLTEEKVFIYNSSVKSVMFCPGSSDVFCGGCQDSSIKIWDARVNNGNNVMNFDHNIPNAHGIYAAPNLKNKKSKVFGVSTVIFKNDQTVISCSSMDPTIKLWDLRKSYRQVVGHKEPLSLMKFCNDTTTLNSGYSDMITNPQLTHLYASGINNIIYCYSLDSTERKPLAQYSGHKHETVFSKISISKDGHYLFSGCTAHRGVIWQTGFPYIELPIFKMLYTTPDFKKDELSTSDWCGDTSELKLATSSDCIPMIWTILPDEERRPYNIRFVKSSLFQSKMKKKCTVPIRLDSELKAKYMKETEENMKMWDIDNTHSALTNYPSTKPPNQSGNMFIKTKSPSTPSLIQISSQVATVGIVPKQIPEVVTPESNKKRKKSILSPQSLIDQYLIPINKRKKSDIDIEKINNCD